MITANVQQTSQTIEIKSAPPPVLAGASDATEEFRAAFAANVREVAANGAAIPAAIPFAVNAPVAEDSSGEVKGSAGAESSTSGSSVHARTEFSSQTNAAIAFALDGAQVSPAGKALTSSSAATAGTSAETPSAAVSSERLSDADAGVKTDSTEDSQAVSLLQGNAPKAADQSFPALTRAPLTSVATGLAAARGLANGPSIGVDDAKQQPRVTTNASSGARKSDVADANKRAVQRDSAQIQPAPLIAVPATLTATADPAGSPIAAHLIAAPAAAERLRAFEPGNPPITSLPTVIAGESVAGHDTEPSVQASRGAVLAGAAGRVSNAARTQRSSTRDRGSLLHQASSDIAKETQAVKVVSPAGTAQDAGGTGAVEPQPAIAIGQSLPVAPALPQPGLSDDDASTLPLRSIGVSERVPASSVLPGVLASGGAGSTSGASEMSEPFDPTSFAIGAGIEASKPEVVSKFAPAVKPAPAESVTQRPAKSDVALARGRLEETKVSTNAEPVAEVPSSEHTGATPQVADAKLVAAQAASLSAAPAAGEVTLPVEIPRIGIATRSAVAAGKATSAKRPVDDPDATVVVPQTTSDAAVPVVTYDERRDDARGVAAIAIGNVAVPSAHPAAAVIAAPVRASGFDISAGANPASARTEVGLNGTQAAQSSSMTQSVEQHRTLLATPTALEIGVQSGTQGWLKIRAEVGGQGEVKASLDAVSASGRDLLHSQLPALNAFLHSEQMPVTASVTERSVATDGSPAGTAMGAGVGDGFAASNGSSLQGGGGHRQAGQHLNSSASEMAKSYDALGGGVDDSPRLSGLMTGASAESGRWLNVRV